MPADDQQGGPDDSQHSEYAKLPTDTIPSVWYWRLRLGAAAVPVVWLMVGDLPPLAVFVLGFATCAAIVLLASALAGLELWVRSVRAERGRK